jgi:hypothetical protein
MQEPFFSISIEGILRWQGPDTSQLVSQCFRHSTVNEGMVIILHCHSTNSTYRVDGRHTPVQTQPNSKRACCSTPGKDPDLWRYTSAFQTRSHTRRAPSGSKLDCPLSLDSHLEAMPIWYDDRTLNKPLLSPFQARKSSVAHGRN